MTTYRVVRIYERTIVPNRIVRRGMSLEEAVAHCEDPKSNSRTAKGKHQTVRTKKYGHWHDAYAKEIK